MAVTDGGGNVGFKVAAKPKPKPVVTQNHTYENPNEVAQGYANRDHDYIGAKAAESDFYRANPTLNPYGHVPAAPPAHRPTGGGSSGGGGGGGSAAPDNTAQLAALDAILASLKGNFDTASATAKTNGDTYNASLDGAYQKDSGAAKQAYADLDAQLSQMGDPYAHIQPAAQAQVDPSQLANLIRSQGGGDAGLMAQAQFLQAQNGAQAGASDRLASMLSANQQAWNQSTRSSGQMAGAQAQDALTARLSAMQEAARQRQGSTQNDLLKQYQDQQMQLQLQKAGLL